MGGQRMPYMYRARRDHARYIDIQISISISRYSSIHHWGRDVHICLELGIQTDAIFSNTIFIHWRYPIALPSNCSLQWLLSFSHVSALPIPLVRTSDDMHIPPSVY